MSNQTKGLLMTALGVFLLTPDSLLIRLMDGHFSTVLFWRCLLAAIVLSVGLVLFQWAQTRSYLLGFNRYSALAVSLLIIGNSCFIFSIQTTYVAHSLVIIALTPLCASLMSRWLLAERINRETSLAIAAAFMGVCVVAYGSWHETHSKPFSGWGDLAALVAAFCLATNLTLVRWQKQQSVIAQLTVSYWLTAALLFIAYQLALVDIAITSKQLAPTLIMGLLVTPIGFSLVMSAANYLPAAEVGLFLLVETLLGPLWVWWFLTEQPNQYVLVGGSVIVLTLICFHTQQIWRYSKKRS